MRRLAPVLSLILFLASSVQAQQADPVEAYAKDYMGFLAEAKTELTTVREVLVRAKAAGFVPLGEGEWKPGARYYAVNRRRTVALIVAGSEPLAAGVRIVGAHIDSPRLELKPKPVYKAQRYALLQTSTHGGIKRYQWVNRPLALLGEIVKLDGTRVEVSFGNGLKGPTLMIPDTAPHEDKPYRTRTSRDVIKGEELDPLLAGPFGSNASKRALALLKQRYGIEAEDLISAELSLVPAMPPVEVGLDAGLIGAYGQDDRACAFAALRAVLALKVPKKTAVAYLVDNEEVGSVGATGARSDWLRGVLGRLLAHQSGPSGESHLRALLAASEGLSADTTTGIDPIYPAPQETSNASRLGDGVVLKLYGKGMDPRPEYRAALRRIAKQADVGLQTHIYKVDVGGGGTIARYMTDWNITVADVGVAVLSQHAPCELAAKRDVHSLYRFLVGFWRG